MIENEEGLLLIYIKLIENKKESGMGEREEEGFDTLGVTWQEQEQEKPVYLEYYAFNVVHHGCPMLILSVFPFIISDEAHAS